MQNKLMLLLIPLLVGCSSTIKMGLISKTGYKAEEVSLTKDGTEPFEISDCAVRVTIIPVNFFIDFEKEIENQCGEDWTIYDYENNISLVSIPLVYGHFCKTLRGRCKK